MVFSLFCLKFWVNYKEKYEAEIRGGGKTGHVVFKHLSIRLL